MKVGEQDSPKDVGQAIVGTCRIYGINPEDVNEGMWYFGAMVAQSEYQLRQAMQDRGRFQSMAHEYVDAVRELVSAFEEEGLAPVS